MNLSPRWVDDLKAAGIDAQHWSAIGRADAPDPEILDYAARHDFILILGTKLRALYQRRKGRDLYDMATALSRGTVDPARIVAAFQRYMDEGGHAVTKPNSTRRCRRWPMR